LSFAPKAKANQLVVLRTTSEKSPTKCFKALQARNTHARNEVGHTHARTQRGSRTRSETGFGLVWFGGALLFFFFSNVSRFVNFFLS